VKALGNLKGLTVINNSSSCHQQAAAVKVDENTLMGKQWNLIYNITA
jgi:hypothetical protein